MTETRESVETRESASTSDQTAAEDETHPATSAEAVHNHPMALQQVKQNMASASMETMQRLQTRKRANPHRRYPSDPMQIEFSPTVRNHPALDEAHRKERRTTSRSTGTSTSNNNNNGLVESNLIAVVLSTLRRFRDHVQSNLLHADFNDEEDRHANLARSLGFDGDLGIEPWSRTIDNADGIHGGGSSTGDRDRDLNRGRDRDRQSHRRYERTPSYASSVSRSSSNARRVNSDCGLESMKHYIDRRHPIHSHHGPSLVE